MNNRKKSFYAWEQIEEISILPFDAAASLKVYDKVFCCFLSTPPANIKEAIFHNNSLYAQRNQNQIVIIDFNEETKSVFSAVYSKEIIDYTVGMNGVIRNQGFKTGDVSSS